MPKRKLTARLVANIKATGKRQEYFDQALSAFCLRVTETGHKSWIVFYRHAGRLTRFTIGNYPALSLKEARQKAKAALNEAANGQDPAAAKADDRTSETFKSVAEQYIERHAMKKKRSWQQDQWYLDRRILPHFGAMRAKEITRRDIRALLEKTSDSTPILANRVRALLSKIFNWALANDIVELNPVTQIPMPGKECRRDRVLAEDEIKTLWKALEAERAGDKGHAKERARSAAILKVQLLTAQRGGEVMGMAWSELDLPTEMWTIPAERTKNGLSHRVPLSRPVMRIIEEMRPLANEACVFPSTKTKEPMVNIQKAIQRVRTKTGIDFHGHDLRRTAATMMAEMRVARLIVGLILNHVQDGVTAIYDRYQYDPEKRDALEAWGRRLMLLISDLKQVQTEA